MARNHELQQKAAEAVEAGDISKAYLDLAALTDDQRGRLQAGFQQLIQFGARQRVVDDRCRIEIKA